MGELLSHAPVCPTIDADSPSPHGPGRTLVTAQPRERAAYLCRAGLLLPARCFRSGSSGRFLAASTAAGLKVERPAGRTTLTPAGATPASMPAARRTVVSSSSRLSIRGVDRVGVAAGAPRLISVLGAGSGRQDGGWGVTPGGVRPLGLCRPSTTRSWRQPPGGSWPQHLCDHGRMRHRPADLGRSGHRVGHRSLGEVRQFGGVHGCERLVTELGQVNRMRRASLRATDSPGRLPPMRSLTSW
jgi:hypothetical protein